MAIRLASLNQILDPWVYLLFRRRLAAVLYSACKTVSPLQNMSSLKALRSEAGQNSSKNSPALKPHSSANGFHSPATRGLEERKDGSGTSLSLKGDSPNGRYSPATGGIGEGKNDSGTSLVLKGDSPNGHYPSAAGGLGQEVCNSGTCLMPKGDSLEECCDSPAFVETLAEGHGSTTYLDAVKCARGGHRSVEVEQDGMGEDFTKDSLLKADHVTGHCSLEAGEGGETRHSCEESHTPLTADRCNGHSCLSAEEPSRCLTSGTISHTEVTAPSVKRFSLENKRESYNSIQHDNNIITHGGLRTDNCNTEHNGIKAPNGSPVRLDTVGTAGKWSALEMDSQVTGPTSCPATCRHDNQTVIKVDNCNQAELENGEYLPLMSKRYSRDEPPSNHCKRASWELNYV